MGTEFYLARPDNKTLFGLGKGLINAAFEHLNDETPARLKRGLPALTREIQAAIAKYTTGAIDPHYPEYVARRVLRWADGMPLLYGTEHTDRWWEWDITGDRYAVARSARDIETLMDELGRRWASQDRLRLGQLLIVIADKDDLFYIEDDELLRRVRQCPECIDEPCGQHVRL